MVYESTVTSKGTITLPASIRKKLGITEGKKVTIVLRGDTIAVSPQGGWDALVSAGLELRSHLQQQGVAYQDIEALRKKAEQIKTQELANAEAGDC